MFALAKRFVADVQIILVFSAHAVYASIPVPSQPSLPSLRHLPVWEYKALTFTWYGPHESLFRGDTSGGRKRQGGGAKVLSSPSLWGPERSNFSNEDVKEIRFRSSFEKKSI